ncbi:hypothetical protein F4561_004818 [Lipingzhangella halophila]|uniref:Uncharacterized protein n=1 Tax=Lipingzhangella halophila TaxID=1783352 RepID=A0A7W7RLY6_9ACTN|nr:hypothetical protein [Lipingzhangella halophila]
MPRDLLITIWFLAGDLAVASLQMRAEKLPGGAPW